ncbi:hypothetical protein [Thiobacillus denitrificans]|uniref:hypothetical protein n=1 Tax=Thiobacillus denitrificans TaxID=36861 RepID=UPI0012F77075|nr:hypothetical protein [Thiobacillus denitrificans]
MKNVFMEDFTHIILVDKGVPDTLWVNDKDWPLVASAKAAGAVLCISINSPPYFKQTPLFLIGSFTVIC